MLVEKKPKEIVKKRKVSKHYKERLKHMRRELKDLRQIQKNAESGLKYIEKNAESGLISRRKEIKKLRKLFKKQEKTVGGIKRTIDKKNNEIKRLEQGLLKLKSLTGLFSGLFKSKEVMGERKKKALFAFFRKKKRRRKRK